MGQWGTYGHVHHDRGQACLARRHKTKNEAQERRQSSLTKPGQIRAASKMGTESVGCCVAWRLVQFHSCSADCAGSSCSTLWQLATSACQSLSVLSGSKWAGAHTSTGAPNHSALCSSRRARRRRSFLTFQTHSEDFSRSSLTPESSRVDS